MGKSAEGGHDLACRAITFVTPDNASLLLNTSCNIAKVVQFLFPILVGRAPTFEEILNWLQFEHTADRTGSYMELSFMVLIPYACWKETLSFLRSDGTSCTASQELILQLRLRVPPLVLTT